MLVMNPSLCLLNRLYFFKLTVLVFSYEQVVFLPFVIFFVSNVPLKKKAHSLTKYIDSHKFLAILAFKMKYGFMDLYFFKYVIM